MVFLLSAVRFASGPGPLHRKNHITSCQYKRISMRISTLLEWTLVAGIFIVAILAVLFIAGLATPGIPVQDKDSTGSSLPATVCSETDLGGFYQSAATSPQPIPINKDDFTFTLQPLYNYRIVGKIVGKDEYSGSPSDSLAPMDLTIANGDIIRPEVLSHFTIRKYPRHFSYHYYIPAGTTQVSQRYATEHISNNHLIFANETVYSTAKSARVGEMVDISGYLVTVSGKSTDGRTYSQGTSTTRSDQGEMSCEVVYVLSFRTYTC